VPAAGRALGGVAMAMGMNLSEFGLRTAARVTPPGRRKRRRSVALVMTVLQGRQMDRVDSDNGSDRLAATCTDGEGRQQGSRVGVMIAVDAQKCVQADNGHNGSQF